MKDKPSRQLSYSMDEQLPWQHTGEQSPEDHKTWKHYQTDWKHQVMETLIRNVAAYKNLTHILGKTTGPGVKQNTDPGVD